MSDSTNPDIQDLQAIQSLQGARFVTIANREIPDHFADLDSDAIAAAQTGVLVCDRSHWGRIEIADDDRLRFLHNQSTNDFLKLTSGQGCETVFVTATARTIDLVSAYVQANSVLLLTHPSCRDSLLKWMDRFIFFADKVKLSDRTDETVAFSLIGPQSLALLNDLGMDVTVTTPHHHQIMKVNGSDVLVSVSSGLGLPGYTLIAPRQDGVRLWQLLSGDGPNRAIPIGEKGWKILRLQQGRPVPGAELTEDYNPLEAGLWHTISFDKGCYIGQETIARLDTYNGVKQQLWGIRLPQIVPPGTPLMVEGNDKKVGILTSVMETEQGVIGLAYVRTKVGGEGLTVDVGGLSGAIFDVPFLTRSR